MILVTLVISDKATSLPLVRWKVKTHIIIKMTFIVRIFSFIRAAYYEDAAPDGAENFLSDFHNNAAPTALKF
jgi:hypothetical protein